MNKLLRKSFWTVTRGSGQFKILTMSVNGLFFKHRNTQLVIQKAANTSETIYGASLETMADIVDCKNLLGKTVNVSYEAHLIGSPIKGEIFVPYYITKIEEIKEK